MQRIAIALALALSLGSACAQPQDPAPPHLGFVGPLPDPQGLPHGSYVIVPADPNAPRIGPGPLHRVLFLNRNGGTYTRGYENSATNTSSIVSGTVNFPAWTYGDSRWSQLVTCVQDQYAPFDTDITDVEPSSGNYIEAVISGRPEIIGMQSNVGGVSPFTNDCTVIERAIVWNFAELYNGNVQALCEVVAQETGHSFGMDHEYHCPDPMTYLTGCGAKTFRDYDARCGEYSARTCACGDATQNSVQWLLQTLGPAPQTQPDTIAPSLNITEPANGATVSAGFWVRATAADNVGVTRLDLMVDGSLTASDMAAPYEWVTSTGLSSGPHSIEVRAFDGAGNMTPRSITVTIPGSMPECMYNTDCGPNELCINQMCQPSTIPPGETGSPCTDNSECVSGMCGDDGSHRYCTEECVTADTCPDGFGCEPAGNISVCWPGSDVTGDDAFVGGCSVTGQSPEPAATWWLVGLALAGLVFARARARTHARRRQTR